MASERAETLQKLCAEYFAKVAGRRKTVYLLERQEQAPAATTINRIAGRPFGVPLEQWPRFEDRGQRLVASGTLERLDAFDGDTRMEHVMTLDLRGLSIEGVPRGAAAMAVFVSHLRMNEAWTPDNDESAVLFLSEAHLELGESPEGPAEGEPGATFVIEAVDVPLAVFDHSPSDRERAESEAIVAEPLPPPPPGQKPKIPPSRMKAEQYLALDDIYRELWKAPARVGGEPFWVQGDPDDDGGGYYDALDDYGFSSSGVGRELREDDGEDEGEAGESASQELPELLVGGGGFLLQLDEAFCPINLGDQGVMYVFGDTAFWQCY